MLSSPTSSSSSSSDRSPLSSFPLLSWLSRSCFLFQYKRTEVNIEQTISNIMAVYKFSTCQLLKATRIKKSSLVGNQI